MAYTNATFYVDPENGSDTARANLAPTAYANNGSGLVRVTHTNSNAAYANDFVVTISGTTGAVYDGSWKATIIDSTHIDLQASTYSSNPAAKGTCTPVGGSSLSDAWKTVGANGSVTGSSTTTFRVKKTPDPTSIGSCTWTGVSKRTGQSAPVNSSTNATPIVVSLTAANYTALGATTGDIVIITNHNTNTNANGVWKISATNGTTTLTLQNLDNTNSVGNGVGGATGYIYRITEGFISIPANTVKNITCYGNRYLRTNWTPVTNVTCSVASNGFGRYSAGGAQTINPTASFTGTGKMAYYTLPATLDLSGYQQVSFAFAHFSGATAIPANTYSIRLCTDTTGDVSVHTVPIRAVTYDTGYDWNVITVDLGTNLNAAIQSVAVYCDSAQTIARGFAIDNIIACKASSSADSLTLRSVISKNTGGDEPWYNIGFVEYDYAMLYSGYHLTPVPVLYNGASGAATTYKVEPFLAPYTYSGYNPTGATISGGWNATDMSTQTGQTFYEAATHAASLFVGNTSQSVTIDKFNFVRGFGQVTIGSLDTIGIFGSGTVYFVGACYIKPSRSNHTGSLIFSGANPYTLYMSYDGAFVGSYNNIVINGATLYIWGTASISAYNGRLTVNTLTISSSGDAAALDLSASYGFLGAYVNQLTVKNALYGVALDYAGLPSVIKQLNAYYCTNAVINKQGTNGEAAGSIYVYGGTITDCTTAFNGTYTTTTGQTGYFFVKGVTYSGVTNVTSSLGFGRATFQDYNGTKNDNRVVSSYGTAVQQTSVKHGSDNFGWKYSPTSTTLIRAPELLEVSIAKVAVAANAAVTFTRWYQRDNVGITISLICRGGQLAGMTLTDYVATISAGVGVWEQLTITFTPTESGVVEFVEQAYGGTTYNAYSSDTAVSQA